MFSDLIYDPDQDPEEKRAVRKNYRSLAKTVEGSSRHPLLYLL
jgi:non-structural maintenance of chromosomes element 4